MIPWIVDRGIERVSDILVGPTPALAIPIIWPCTYVFTSFLGVLFPETGVNGALGGMVQGLEVGVLKILRGRGTRKSGVAPVTFALVL